MEKNIMDEKFIFRLGRGDRELLDKLSAQFRRSRSETLRMTIEMVGRSVGILPSGDKEEVNHGKES